MGWSNQIAELQQIVQIVDEEIARLQKRLADRAEANLDRDSEEINSLRRTMGNISGLYAKKKAELQ